MQICICKGYCLYLRLLCAVTRGNKIGDDIDLFPTICCQYAVMPNWCKIPMKCYYCMLFLSKVKLIVNAAHLQRVPSDTLAV